MGASCRPCRKREKCLVFPVQKNLNFSSSPVPRKLGIPGWVKTAQNGPPVAGRSWVRTARKRGGYGQGWSDGRIWFKTTRAQNDSDSVIAPFCPDGFRGLGRMDSAGSVGFGRAMARVSPTACWRWSGIRPVETGRIKPKEWRICVDEKLADVDLNNRAVVNCRATDGRSKWMRRKPTDSGWLPSAPTRRPATPFQTVSLWVCRCSNVTGRDAGGAFVARKPVDPPTA